MSASPLITEWRGWTLHDYEKLDNTTDTARTLPPWHSVRARIQTTGRGRHGRRWVSEEGGLWISSVLPLDPPDAGWPAFPLAAGLAVASTLRHLGIHTARLRWPNDVLIGSRKICGILMEKYSPDRVIVGLGLNVTNRPQDTTPDLAAIVTSLDQELSPHPSPDDLYHSILTALRILHGRVAEEGFASLVDDINRHWGEPRQIELTLANETIRGHFLGIDQRGDLLVETNNHTSSHSAPYVQLLREI